MLSLANGHVVKCLKIESSQIIPKKAGITDLQLSLGSNFQRIQRISSQSQTICSVCDKLKTIVLAEDEIKISFDLTSLYTNVPVMESITVCTDLMFNLPVKYHPPVDRETFMKLATIASCDVVMSTHDGFFKQVDGLAMGSPPAPHLANGWLSQYRSQYR